MRRIILGCLGSLAVVPAIVIACGGSSGSGAGDEIEAGVELLDAPAGDAVAPPIDATSLPQAKGDPCRGVPLPVDQAYVPAGMCASVVASALGAIRQLTFAPNGDLFGVTSSGAIKRFRDTDDDGFFQLAEITTYAQTGGNGNNCHIDAANGYLYAGSSDGVKRWPYSPDAASGGAAEDVVTGQPGDGHSKHTVHVYDGFLYVQSGSAGNASAPKLPDYDDQRSLIRRFPLASFKPGTPFAWLSGEVVTLGLRNPNGFTKNAAGRMYAVVNGLDQVEFGGVDVHNDNPGEQLVEIAMGKKYGYPYCFTAQRVVTAGQVVAPGTQLPFMNTHDQAWCAANSSPPTTFVQAHSAPLDLTFFDTHPKGALPEHYRGGAFVALHGSWNRSPATGYKVVWIPFDADGKSPMPTSTATDTTFPYEVILGGGDATGPKDGAWSWSAPGGDYSDQPRFAGVAVSPVDGALYATSDSGGYVYRVGAKQTQQK
jgi:glucose/arabinose dehydrogenase